MGQSQAPAEDAQDRTPSSPLGTQSFSSVPPYMPKMTIQNSNATSVSELHSLKIKLSHEIHVRSSLVNTNYLWQ